MQLVIEDTSLEDNAVREVYEETGLKITKNALVLLGVLSDTKTNPVCIAVQYMVKLNDIPKLLTYDSEFINDDLRDPVWVKLSDIKYNSQEKMYFIQTHKVALEEQTVKIINLGLGKLNIKRML